MTSLLPPWLLVVGIGMILSGIFALGFVSPAVFFGMAILAIVSKVLYHLYRRQSRVAGKIIVLVSPLVIVLVAIGVRTYFRYQTATVMPVTVQEYSNDEYPEDPADRNVNYSRYQGRKLVLIQRDATHFDSSLNQHSLTSPKSSFAM